MNEIIDLSQEIFAGMPVFPGLPEVEMALHVSHDQWYGITDSDNIKGIGQGDSCDDRRVYDGRPAQQKYPKSRRILDDRHQFS